MCYTFDLNGERCSPASGAQDMRTNLPACLQDEPDWCWATAVSEVAAFYGKVSKPPLWAKMMNSSLHSNDVCSGNECRVVGHKNNPNDPDACCRDKAACGKITGTEADVINGLKWLAGVSYYYIQSHGISASLLDKVLLARHPVILGVGWSGGGGHVLTVGGTDGRGRYYIHDPLNQEQFYQALSYDQILAYHPPWNPSVTGTWRETAIPTGFAEHAATEDSV